MTIAVNLYLLVMSFCDIKYRKVPLIGLVLFFFSGLIYNVFFSDMGITLWLGGILTGFSFLFISYISKEKIGYGDSLLLTGIGAWMGTWYIWGVCLVAFFLGFIFAVFIIIKNFKRRNKDMVIPFVPFLFCGSLYMTFRGII